MFLKNETWKQIKKENKVSQIDKGFSAPQEQ